MTDNYVRNRIEDIEGIIRSLQSERDDPESKGPRRTEMVSRAIQNLRIAVGYLRSSLED